LSAANDPNNPRDHEGPDDDDRAQEQEAALAALTHDLQVLPTVSDPLMYGQTIEHIKNMLFITGRHIGDLKELAERIKKMYADAQRGSKATLNDADKKALAERCAGDETLRSIEASVRELSELWAKWDARRSRLNREFEFAKSDYQAQRAMDAAEVSARYYRDAAAAASVEGSRVLDELRSKLRDAADHLVARLRSL
jgi:hypothetical protein